MCLSLFLYAKVHARGVKFQRLLRKDTAFDRLEERSFSVIIFQSRAFVISLLDRSPKFNIVVTVQYVILVC